MSITCCHRPLASVVMLFAAGFRCSPSVSAQSNPNLEVPIESANRTGPDSRRAAEQLDRLLIGMECDRVFTVEWSFVRMLGRDPIAKDVLHQAAEYSSQLHASEGRCGSFEAILELNEALRKQPLSHRPIAGREEIVDARTVVVQRSLPIDAGYQLLCTAGSVFSFEPRTGQLTLTELGATPYLIFTLQEILSPIPLGDRVRGLHEAGYSWRRPTIEPSSNDADVERRLVLDRVSASGDGAPESGIRWVDTSSDGLPIRGFMVAPGHEKAFFLSLVKWRGLGAGSSLLFPAEVVRMTGSEGNLSIYTFKFRDVRHRLVPSDRRIKVGAGGVRLIEQIQGDAIERGSDESAWPSWIPMFIDRTGASSDGGRPR